MLQGSFRWFVWVTFTEIEEVFTNLVNSYPAVAVPKLIPMSTSQYDRLRNNVISSNNEIEKACFFVYQFKNNYPRGKSYSNTTSSQPVTARSGYTVDTNRIYHEKILLLSWLKSIQHNSMLANSEFVRQLFHLKPYVEATSMVSKATLPGSATKNKNDVVNDGVIRYTGNSYDNIRYLFSHSFVLLFSHLHKRTHSFKI